MARKTHPFTSKRRARIRRVQALKAQGLTSAEIGRRLGIAPSTVRDYWTDPTRRKARARQRRLGVDGVTIDGMPVESVKAKWERGGPVQGESAGAARARGRQLRAIIGYRVRGR